MNKCRLPVLPLLLAAFLPALAGCNSPRPGPAASRGFLEPAQFTAALVPNPATADAPDRSPQTVFSTPIHPDPVEFARHESMEFPFVLSNRPVVARLSADLWHQGSSLRPAIAVNGRPAGAFDVSFPSLAHRNYSALLFDSRTPPAPAYSFNYQGWLPAAAILKGDLFHPGTNSIRVSVGLDRIKLANLSLESLVGFDPLDTSYDLRTPPPAPPAPPPPPPNPAAPPAESVAPPPPPPADPLGGSNVSHLVRSQSLPAFDSFSFDGVLNAQLYDLAADACDVWIASAAGLLRFARPENQWILYDRSSGFPGDFPQRLFLWNGYLAFEAWNRHDRNYVLHRGNFLFNPSSREWIEIPRNHPFPKPEGATVRGIRWIPLRGTNVPGTRDFLGGGVLRVNPSSGEERLFSSPDGLADDYCSDLAADSRFVWASHWYEAKGLSAYDLRAKTWSALSQSSNGIDNLGGTRLLLNGNSLFVGQQSGLARVDVLSREALRFLPADGLPGAIVAGLAANRAETWIAAYSPDRSAGLAVFARRSREPRRPASSPAPVDFPAPASAKKPSEKLARRASLASDERHRAVLEEIASLPSHPWAGDYFFGDGLGANVSLALAPKSGFVYQWRGCLGIYDRNYGAVSQTDAASPLRLLPAHGTETSGFKELPAELVPVPWGQRVYLVDPADSSRFCAAVNSGTEPRAKPHGQFFLRKGDEFKPAPGLPLVPDSWRPPLLLPAK